MANSVPIENQNNIAFLQLGDGPALRGFVNDCIQQYNNFSTQKLKGVAFIPQDNEARKELVRFHGAYTLMNTGIGKSLKCAKTTEITCLSNAYPIDHWSIALQYAKSPSLHWLFTDMSGSAAVSPHDDSITAPNSLPGWVCAFLYARYMSGNDGISIICCENIPLNGELLRSSVHMLIGKWNLDSQFGEWVVKENHFISSRVMRNSRIMHVADKNNSAPAQNVIVAEGFHKWWIQAHTIPTFLDRAKKQITLVDTWDQYDTYARLWQTAHFSACIMTSVFHMAGIPATMQDTEIRNFLAHLMMDEILEQAISDKREGLLCIAESFERLENLYYEAEALPTPQESMMLFRNLMLPCILERSKTGCAPKLTVALLGFMLMDMIMEKKEKRLHAISCDMEPEMLTYAVLSDAALGLNSLRRWDELEDCLTTTFRNLQILGARETMEHALSDSLFP